jgi:DNA polymerase elongation subunit (family B)
MALKYQDLITEYYDTLAREAFNIQEHRLEMKTECTIRSGFFSGKRRYAQYITKKEGIKVEDIDVKGLDFMKSNFPPLFKKFFNEILNKILFGATRNKIDQEILEFKNSLDTLPLEMLGKPTGVKDIKKYVERPPGAGNIFTTLKTGAPVNVKAAVRYNDFLKFKGLDKQHSQIVQGDKIKWVYLKDNPYKIDTMGFLDFDFPEGIRTFVETYIDRDKAFDSILKNKLETFYKDLSWGSLTLNTHVNNFFSF